MVDDAVRLLVEMNEKGILVDVVSCNSLIHGLCDFVILAGGRRLQECGERC